MLYQTKATIARFLEYQTVQTYSIRREEKLEFPSVTICVERFVRLSQIKRELRQRKCEKPRKKEPRICTMMRRFRGHGEASPSYKTWHNFKGNFSGVADRITNRFQDWMLETDFEGEKIGKDSKYWKSTQPKCHTFNHEEKDPLYQRSEKGLQVILRTNWDNIWYKVNVHAPGSISAANEDTVVICTGTILTFERERRTFLGKPYGDCISAWSEREEMKALLKKNPVLGKHPYSEDACRRIVWEERSKSENDTKETGSIVCPRQCVKNLYKTDYLTSMQPNVCLRRGKPQKYRAARLTVRSKYLEEKNISSVPVMTFEQLVGNVGGLFGLWLGASLLSLMEICELLTNIVYRLMECLGNIVNGSTRVSAKENLS